MENKKYIDPDEKLKFKEINLRITEEVYNEWTEWADKHNKPLVEYIKSCVESQAIRELIINYLKERAKNKPWWEKKYHDL
jgi:hypothetical protein